MPSMLCTFEACSAVINAGDRVQPGPLPPCPTCGQVNFWPPTAPENALKKRGALDTEFERKLHEKNMELERWRRSFEKSTPTEQPNKFDQVSHWPPTSSENGVFEKTLRSIREDEKILEIERQEKRSHVVTDCPCCKRPLRLPYSQVGRIARCPRRDCGASFPWNPGQEITGFDAWCSSKSTKADPRRFSVTFMRHKGSIDLFRIQVIEKGTGHIDRAAAGNNYDQITQHGQVDYDRRQSNVPLYQLSLSNLSCPWCYKTNIASCTSCKAILCFNQQAPADQCPACERRFRPSPPIGTLTHIAMRGASFTPNKPTGAGNNSPSLMDRLRKRLGGGG